MASKVCASFGGVLLLLLAACSEEVVPIPGITTEAEVQIAPVPEAGVALPPIVVLYSADGTPQLVEGLTFHAPSLIDGMIDLLDFALLAQDPNKELFSITLTSVRQQRFRVRYSAAHPFALGLTADLCAGLSFQDAFRARDLPRSDGRFLVCIELSDGVSSFVLPLPPFTIALAASGLPEGGSVMTPGDGARDEGTDTDVETGTDTDADTDTETEIDDDVPADTSAPKNVSPRALTRQQDERYAPTWEASAGRFRVKACTDSACSQGCVQPVEAQASGGGAVSGLVEGVAYRMCVQRVTQSGTQLSSWTASSAALIRDTTSPPTPTQISPAQKLRKAGTSFVPFWTQPSGDSIERYEVKACATSTCTSCLPTQTALSIGAATVSGLSSCASYHVCVRSIDFAGNASLWAASESVVAMDTLAPPAVTGLVLANDANQIRSPTASWQGAVDNCGVGSYAIAIGTTSGATNVSPWRDIGTGTSHQLRSGVANVHLALALGTSYYLSVRGTDIHGNTGPAASAGPFQINNLCDVNAVGHDAEAPSAPSSLTAGAAQPSDRTPLFSWHSSQDICGILRYQVSIGTSAGAADSIGWTSVGTALSHSFVRSASLAINLNPQTYYANVRAEDNVGNISSVSSVSFAPASFAGTGTNSAETISAGTWNGVELIGSNGADTLIGSMGADTIYGDDKVVTAPAWASFNPSSIGTVRTWHDAYDGSTVTVTGGKVSALSDKSGNGYHLTQSNANIRPTYDGTIGNKAALRFQGNEYLWGNAVIAGGDDDYTIAAVWQASQTGIMAVWEQADHGGGRRGSLLIVNGAYGYNGESNDAHHIANYSPSSIEVSIMNYVNGAVSLWDDGTLRTGNVNNDTANIGTMGVCLGCKVTNLAEKFYGAIGEVIVFGSSLDSAGVTALQSYFDAKWRGTASSHPAARDTLTGGGGADTFIWNAASTGGTGSSGDIITDFNPAQGDEIHISGFAQAPVYVGEGSFSAARLIRWTQQGADTRVQVNLNGGAIDLEILLQNFTASSLSPGDFVIDQTIETDLPQVPELPAVSAAPILWYKADSLELSDGARVSSWLDSSGNGNHATNGSLGTQPVFKTNVTGTMPSVYFGDGGGVETDGQGNHLLFNSRVNNIRTVIAVLRHVENNRAYEVYIGSANDYQFHGGSGDSLFDGGWSADGIRAGAIYLNGASVHYSVARPNTFSILSLVTSGNVAADALSYERGIGGRYWGGYISEVILYSSPLSNVDLTEVETYLESKYGL